ncbi:MAG: hypothetical protein GXC73_03125 [Chitinophagaceae bacterium]|nr:hypothetical protein [Chitinophagaceae bacterium]
MSIPNNFAAYYTTISNAELLSILDNPENYQAVAIDAAKQELVNRKLSETELNEAREELNAVLLQEAEQKEKRKAFEEKLTNTGHELIDTISPVQPGSPSAERMLRFLVIVFGIMALYWTYKRWEDEWYYSDTFPGFDEGLLYYLPLLAFIAGTVLLWMRKSTGWSLLVIYMTVSAATVLLISGRYTVSRFSEGAVTDEFVYWPSPYILVTQLLFYGGSLWALCSKGIRQLLLIGENKFFFTFLVAAVLAFLSVLTMW